MDGLMWDRATQCHDGMVDQDHDARDITDNQTVSLC